VACVDVLNVALLGRWPVDVGMNGRLVATVAWAERTCQTWCVWCGLRAQLSKVHIRTSPVADSHGFAQLVLGVEAVEDDAVHRDCDGLDHNLDDDADKTPVLQAADKVILHFLLEEALALVVDAGPSPHVLVVRVVLRALQSTSSNAPHDDTEDEETNGEGGVVDRRLLGATVPTLPVRVEDPDAHR